jgi:hypothetical protein
MQPNVERSEIPNLFREANPPILKEQQFIINVTLPCQMLSEAKSRTCFGKLIPQF